MAFIKSKTLQNGTTGTYWRILQNNGNAQRKDKHIELALYLSKAQRLASPSDPLPYSVTFNFAPGDHPLSELDPDSIDIALIEDVDTLENHLVYQHIKAVASLAAAKDEIDRSANEHTALFFVDAQDDV